MPKTDILIIGGGPAGLSMGGALKRAGLEATILDRSERIGQSWEGRYERLHLHTVRNYSGLAHYPIPSTYPKYLSKDQYAGYLREYASHFDLNVVPGTLVKKVRQEEKDGRMGWAADTGTDTWHARAVVLATGPFGQPVWPEWLGLSQFGGETMHSSRYLSGRVFQKKKVLVVGAGNSGAEIAVDLCEQGASQVAISIRNPPPIVPRDFLGTPAQVFGILMNSFPPSLSDRVGAALSRLALGDLRRWGLPSPNWKPFSSQRTPVIDVGFAAALKAGKIAVRPGIDFFTPTGAVYLDCREEPFDAVIFATGFRSGLGELLEPEGLVDQNGNPRFRSGERTSCQGLYFMGFFDSLRGFLYETNIASRRLAREMKRGL